jgi:hypothetical protein
MGIISLFADMTYEASWTLVGPYFFCAVFFYLLTVYFVIIYIYSIKVNTGYANQNKNHHCEFSHPAWGGFVLLLRGFLSDGDYTSGQRRFNNGCRIRTGTC